MADKTTPINSSMTNMVEKLIQEAEKEVYDEMTKKAKTKLVNKLREQKQAARLLANINREIEEIKLELGHDLES